MAKKIKDDLEEYLSNNVTTSTAADGTEQYTYTGGISDDPYTSTGGTVWIDSTVPSVGTTTSPYTISTGSGSYSGVTNADWSFNNPTDDTLEKVCERLEAIEKRLSIVDKAPDDKIKALEEAYAHYKFIEKLCEGEENELGKEPE